MAFRNTHGQLPQAGVDLEPDQDSQLLSDIRFVRAEFSGNSGMGLMTHVRSELDGLSIEDSLFFNNATQDWNYDLQISATLGGVIRNVRVLGSKLEDNIYVGGSSTGGQHTRG